VENGRRGDTIEMMLTVLLFLIATSAGPSTSGICEQVRGWERAVEQRPSPVPYSEPVRNVAVQLSRDRWTWNARTVPEAQVVSYLRKTRALNPAPLNLFAFLPKLSCSDRRALQTKIAKASACAADGKPCLEGTDAEYRAARNLP
jgi:hypothetical protein